MMSSTRIVRTAVVLKPGLGLGLKNLVLFTSLFGIHWPLIWYNEEVLGQAAAPPSPLLTVPNVTAPIHGQCTNFILFDVHSKGLTKALRLQRTDCQDWSNCVD